MAPQRWALLWFKPAGEGFDHSAASVADDLRIGLNMLATGRVNGELHPEAQDIALEYLRRAAPGVDWAASGVIG